MPDEEEKPIRVVDRRMFTPDGELRPEYRTENDAPAPAPAEPAAAPAAAPPPPPSAAPAEDAVLADAASGEPMPDAEGQPPPEPRTAFALIVQVIAMPAYAALGMVPDPASGRRRVDRAAAQEMIDLLAVLEQKTRGNLSFEESNFLSRVLYDLRLAFVEVSRPPRK
jgi:hypothetical protein